VPNIQSYLLALADYRQPPTRFTNYYSDYATTPYSYPYIVYLSRLPPCLPPSRFTDLSLRRSRRQ
jgi:hypothetical protein